MIVTNKLTKVYGGFFGSSVLAVDNIDLEVDRKDIFGFLGPNGAGKTTTIHMFTTVLEPTSGTAEICGYDITKSPLIAKRKIGFMPEMPGFYDWLKAEDQLKFYCDFYGYSRQESKTRAKELMELVGMGEFRNRKIKTFSHGMRKRLALASAMVNDPEILILDEPMGGLDPMGVHSFREMIKELNRNDITIFLSSHLLPEVQQLCNKVGIINRGKILAVDTIDNLSRKVGLESFTRLTIDGKGLSEKVLDFIKTIPGVAEIRVNSQRERGYTIIVNEGIDIQDLAGVLNEKLVKRDVYLSRLEQAKPNLEELFMKITRGS
ncbi:MAG: ABC transporter ATP-binding protein [Thermoplasmata archaeon]|nr:MAG: ABC transporter ATP-binding protein [Thermoplasmata archaeon]